MRCLISLLTNSASVFHEQNIFLAFICQEAKTFVWTVELHRNRSTIS